MKLITVQFTSYYLSKDERARANIFLESSLTTFYCKYAYTDCTSLIKVRLVYQFGAQMFFPSLDSSVPPPIGAANVLGLDRELEDEVVLLRLQVGVAPPAEVGEAAQMAVVEVHNSDILVRQLHFLKASEKDKV